jgi:uncharacterized membrane protein YhhN
MNLFLIAALLLAALQALALHRDLFKLEVIAKPGVMIVLFLWLWTSVGLGGAPGWFALGILFSLVGDVLLMLSLDRFFLAGLAAFLLAHIAYVVGFNIPIPEMSAWGIGMAIILGVGGARVIRRILDAVIVRGQAQLRIPIAIYGVVITLMLLSAMLKQFDVTWEAGAALLVSAGAFLFYISDIILAWNKFIAPIQHGRIYNIAAYHLGQITLIAGVIAQYAD